jgi:hypothetical protein
MSNKPITDYWFKYYATDHCTICGNYGVIDSRGVKTPAGFPVGRLNYCICPNGQALRKGNADLEWWATHE